MWGDARVNALANIAYRLWNVECGMSNVESRTWIDLRKSAEIEKPILCET